MKDILGAGKKPSTITKSEAPDGLKEGAAESLSVLAPEQMNRLKVVIEGEDDESIDEFVNYIRAAL